MKNGLKQYGWKNALMLSIKVQISQLKMIWKNIHKWKYVEKSSVLAVIFWKTCSRCGLLRSMKFVIIARKCLCRTRFIKVKQNAVSVKDKTLNWESETVNCQLFQLFQFQFHIHYIQILQAYSYHAILHYFFWICCRCQFKLFKSYQPALKTFLRRSYVKQFSFAIVSENRREPLLLHPTFLALP